MMELPSGWVLAQIADVAIVSTGNTPSTKRAANYGADVPFIKPGDLNDQTIATTPNGLSFEGVEIGRTVAAGTVLVSCIGNLGKTGLVRSLSAFNQQINAVTPFVGLDSRFLMRQFQSGRFREKLEEQASATTIQIINKGSFERLSIVIPPTNEQRRIVEKIEARFDEIDKGVESLKTAKTALGLYRQSLLKSAFEGRLTADWRARNADKLEAPETLLASLEEERGAWYESEFQRWREDVAAWESSGSKGPKPRKPDFYKRSVAITDAEHAVLPPLPNEWVYVRLNDIAYVGSGMSVSKARKLEAPVETPYLRVANVQRGHLDLGEIKTMPVEQSQLAGLQLRTWDILFNEGGDRDKLGRGWIWEDQVEICITQNHVFRATPFRHDKGWSQFVSQWGNSYGRDYFEAGGKQTTNLASINKTVLKALPVPICSPAEQAEIVRILDARLEAADALEAQIDAALTRASALRQSILKKAFSGQLVPQDPADEPASALLERIKAERAKAPKTRTRLVQA